MTDEFRAAMFRKMVAVYLRGSPTQRATWRLYGGAGRYAAEQTCVWPFDVEDDERRALAERLDDAILGDELA